MADEHETIPSRDNVAGLRFAVPTTVVQDDLSPAVAVAFLTALTRLSEAGAKIIEVPMKEFARVPEVNPRGAIASYEAYSFHRQWITEAADKYDPRVIERIRPGESITTAKYKEHLQLREQFIRSINAAASGYDAMLMPTVREIAPTIAEVIAGWERTQAMAS